MRIAAAFLVLLAACGPRGPQARINKAFDEAVRAVETGDAAGAAASLSPLFAGPDGMDRAQARLYLMALLHREKVGVTVLSRRLSVEGREAVQSVDLLLTGRAGEGLLPRESSRRSLVLRWELRGGEWVIREIQTD
jgi:hypothetical protein